LVSEKRDNECSKIIRIGVNFIIIHKFIFHILFLVIDSHESIFFYGYCNIKCDIIFIGYLLKTKKQRSLSMNVCYNKLFKLLIDKGMKKTDLRLATGISPNTLSKLSNNEYVSMEVLVKICRVLHCDVGDIMEVVITDSKDVIATK